MLGTLLLTFGRGARAAVSAVVVSVFAALAAPAPAAVVTGEVTWSGVVQVEEDVYVAPGARLAIEPGTRVVFAEAPSTKTDPAFWSGGTELAVAGTLVVRGSADAPVAFEGAGAWGGIVAAPGGSVNLEGAVLRGAQEGVLVVEAACGLRDVEIEGSEYGLVLGPGARLEASGVRLEGCRIGVLDLRGAAPSPPTGVDARGTRDAARLVGTGEVRSCDSLVPQSPPEEEARRVEFLGEHAVERSETWSGEVIVTGRVTVAPGAVLTLQPGTRVGFRRVDSNADGLGESELLVLGGLRSLGTPGAPVVFESAEAAPRAGDWDKVSLISSEDPDNLLRYTVFRHGVQALHAHFSAFAAEDCYFEDNLRAAQFQESPGARLRRCVFRANKQALRFRDSTASVTESVFLQNLYAVHAFRCDLEFVSNTLEDNVLGGFLAKESRVSFRGNRARGNRDGARMRDAGSSAEVVDNRFEQNVETAVSLSEVSGVLEGNLLDGAGLDLVGVEASTVVLRGNDFGGAGRDALHLEGTADVEAVGNYWGGDPAARIHDGADEPGLGRVIWSPLLVERPRLDLPRPLW